MKASLQCPRFARWKCSANLQDEEEAEAPKPVKAEKPSRDFVNGINKKTNLRSEDQTFKHQEEQRCHMQLRVQ